MKWAFAIQRKIRLAIVLTVMMLFIILFSMMESYNVNKIRNPSIPFMKTGLSLPQIFILYRDIL